MMEEHLEPLREVERRHIEHVLRRVGGDRRQACRILGLSRWALARRLRKFGLAQPEDRPERLQPSPAGT